jgi:hypothetical protein
VIHRFREEADVNRDRFWLTEEQFSRIAPHLLCMAVRKPSSEAPSVVPARAA